MGSRQDSITKDHLQEIFDGLCEKFGLASLSELQMHLLAYIMRPNQGLCQKARHVMQASQLPAAPEEFHSADVSIHFRAGDKHDASGTFVKQFETAFQKLFGEPNLPLSALLSSDDFEAINTFDQVFGKCSQPT